jgi:nicotinamide-nucleotide amidase
MRELVLAVSKKLLAQQLQLVTAESCTGGGLSYHLTSLSGSSEWFERGFVTYSNLSKIEMLGVKHLTLDKFGAVSAETAREMAEGALRHSHAHISVAITGIAGPTGGTDEKPVGTVYFSWAGMNRESITRMELLKKSRKEIREQSIRIALEGLLSL